MLCDKMLQILNGMSPAIRAYYNNTWVKASHPRYEVHPPRSAESFCRPDKRRHHAD